MKFLRRSPSVVIWLSTKIDEFLRYYCHEPLEVLKGTLWTQPQGFIMTKEHPLKDRIDELILKYLKSGRISRLEHETQRACDDHDGYKDYDVHHEHVDDHNNMVERKRPSNSGVPDGAVAKDIAQRDSDQKSVTSRKSASRSAAFRCATSTGAASRMASKNPEEEEEWKPVEVSSFSGILVTFWVLTAIGVGWSLVAKLSSS